MDEFGRMAVRLTPRLPGIPWPEKKVLKDEEVAYFPKTTAARASMGRTDATSDGRLPSLARETG